MYESKLDDASRIQIRNKIFLCIFVACICFLTVFVQFDSKCTEGKNQRGSKRVNKGYRGQYEIEYITKKGFEIKSGRDRVSM